MIPFYKHNLVNKNYLKKTLQSYYLTSGPKCEEVENILKKRFSKNFAYLTNSWTNSVISILLALIFAISYVLQCWYYILIDF